MTVPRRDSQFPSAPRDELLIERLEPPPAGVSDFDGDQQDREDRLSLRRVSGMSTELADITEVEYRQLLLERVVLVSVWTTGSEVSAENSIAELKLLAETAGSQVLEGLIQRRDRPDPATYIGRGKVAELRDVIVATGADTVICDGELTLAQLRNLEDRVGVKVIDRTALILDIFAAHAKSAEGKAQVELAQLQYLKQRLAAGVATSPGRSAVAPAAALASEAVVLARRSWKPIDGGSTPGLPSYELRFVRWIRPAKPNAQNGAGIACRLLPSLGTPMPASPACSIGSPVPAYSSMTRFLQRWIRPPVALQLRMAGYSR